MSPFLGPLGVLLPPAQSTSFAHQRQYTPVTQMTSPTPATFIIQTQHGLLNADFCTAHTETILCTT